MEEAFAESHGKTPSTTVKAPVEVVTKAGVSLNVREMGAKGDGTSVDTLALQQALDRCGLLGGGEVVVPTGQYLTGALALRSRTTLRLEEGAELMGSPSLADYPLTQVRWEGRFIKGYLGLISALDAEAIAIVGKGKITGNDAIKGRVNRETGVRHPALLEFVGCKGVRVEGCVTQQNDMWSIHPMFCEDVVFRNVTVHGGADGIDVDSCQRVAIEGCEFQTGDDCISLKSGRGEEGYTLLRTTEDVRIADCTFRDAHWACIGIGSETSGGIRRVLVERCKCLGAKTHAIYIKSRPGRGAFLEDITMRELEVSGVGLGFLRINILSSGKQDEFPVPGLEGIPTIRNFRFSDIRVTEVPVLVDAWEIHPEKPLEGFLLERVTGTCAKGMSLAHIRHAVLKDIRVTGFAGPLLSTNDVTGTGLAGAVPLPPTKTPDPVVVPAEKYRLR
jgi:polygalacturonase